MFKWLKKYLGKIEEANKKSFGNSKLDCCDLNRKGNASKKSNTEKNSQTIKINKQ